MISKELIYALLIIGGIVLLYILYRKNFKILKVPSVCLITGAPKTGKSLLSVQMSSKDYRKRHRKWWVLTKIFKRKIEEPLFYTNVTFSFGNIKRGKPHRLDKNIRKIDIDLLYRNNRFAYGSVIYLQEASLLADNMDYNNQDRNVDLSLLNKLICHETRGGSLYYDTQSVLDCHYSIKRVCSTYLFIQKNLNILVGRVLYVREMINTENGINDFNDDVDTTTRKVFVPFWYYHKYDRYEFSYLTDDLAEKSDKFKKGNREFVSFNPLYIRRADKRRKQ